MTTTPVAPPGSPVRDVEVRDVEVRDLDVRGVLAGVVVERRAADRAEARMLALAVHYVDLHPVTDGHLVVSAGPSTRVPEVAEHAVAGLGAVLGVSYGAADSLVTDALTLRHRLPRLWALTQDGRLQPWKARKVAQAVQSADGPAGSRPLLPEVLSFLDGHVSVSARHNRLPAGTLTGLIHEALLRCDPETALGREEAALADRDVTFTYGRSTAPCATAELTATLDVLDALDLDLDHQITDLAADMRHLGDTSPLGVRRAHALGMLANPQHTLDIFNGTADIDAATATATDDATRRRTQSQTRFRSQIRTVTTTLHLHLSTHDLRDHSDGHPGAGTSAGTGAWVEKLGPATLDLLHDWLQRATGVTVRPVLDIAHLQPVDAHDPPEAMREAVIARDRYCVFPGCRIAARSCDLDHTVAYVPLEDGGPPGQTQPRQPRRALQATPPPQDLHHLDLPPPPARPPRTSRPAGSHRTQLPVDQSPRPLSPPTLAAEAPPRPRSTSAGSSTRHPR